MLLMFIVYVDLTLEKSKWKENKFFSKWLRIVSEMLCFSGVKIENMIGSNTEHS